MKLLRLFCTALLLFCATRQLVAQSQEGMRRYPHWRVDVLGGKAFGWQPGNQLGLLTAAEARYNFDDVLSFGLRAGLLQMARGFYDESLQLRRGNTEASASILGTADYYLNEGWIRGFIGGGTGIFNLTSATHIMQGGNTQQVPAEARFGWMLRAGAESGYLRLAAEFNGMGKSAGVYNHFAGISLGIIIGGSKPKTRLP